ncbi:hypothetical protein [Desulfosarcina ovata]|uniref:Uncharacterized protein n=1 Tax=Desulfosarcina ovata subsp. ovata TaxID=2752305 RepID=A0A5K8A3P7_9BACT|nr:hypothetical protein [Desulfosarcina ovata]BBO87091.1 hypothetical protein DSCOOX_02710 [Desulfosarcina ovata subsp. ovata]
MTHEDAGHYAAKHPGGEIDPTIAEAIAAKEKDGKITCSAAHAIAEKHGCTPQTVGMTIDLLEKRIHKCQLGLFGYGDNKEKAIKATSTVAEPLKHAIEKAVDNERISCAAAWTVAKEMNMSKLEISSACEAMGIKITKCQLGAF